MPWTCLAPDPCSCVGVQLHRCTEPLPCCKVRLCHVASGSAVLQRRSAATEPPHYVAMRSNGCTTRAHAHAKADSPTHQTEKQTHRQPHTRECEHTHARQPERESAALRCAARRLAAAAAAAMRCVATGHAVAQQVAMRCNRCCVVATGAVSLQHDELRCSKTCCVAAVTDASYIGAHLR